MAQIKREIKGSRCRSADADHIKQQGQLAHTTDGLYRCWIMAIVMLLAVAAVWRWISPPAEVDTESTSSTYNELDAPDASSNPNSDPFRSRIEKGLAAMATAHGRQSAKEVTDPRPIRLPESDGGKPALAAFNTWLDQYLTAESAQRPDLEAAGVALATARRSELKGLIASDPRTSLAVAIPLAARQELPASIRGQLEHAWRATPSLK